MRPNNSILPRYRYCLGKLPSLIVWGAIGAVLVGLGFADDLYAQRSPGSAGVGVQIGRPGGLTLKAYAGDGIAYDAILTTDADDYVAAYVHRVWEEPLPDSPLHLFFGPGLHGGIAQIRDDARLRFGVSSEAGLNFYAERFEVFLHVTPTLRFFPNSRASLDGNVGLRYYFGRSTRAQ